MFKINYKELPQNYRLRLARQCRFKKSKEFAESIGVATTNYSSHESGSRGIRDSMLKKYCTALEANYAWVKSGEGVCYDNPQLQGLIDEWITAEHKPQTQEFYLPAFNTEVLKVIITKMHAHNKNYTPAEEAAIIAKAYAEILAVSKDEAEQLQVADVATTAILKFLDTVNAGKNPS